MIIVVVGPEDLLGENIEEMSLDNIGIPTPDPYSGHNNQTFWGIFF